jgi:hypothetical protein
MIATMIPPIEVGMGTNFKTKFTIKITNKTPRINSIIPINFKWTMLKYK